MIPRYKIQKATLLLAGVITWLFLLLGTGQCVPEYAYDRVDQKAERQKYLAKLADDNHKVDLAIKSTKTLIDQSKGRPYLAELHLRLAELYIEKSRIVYFLRKKQVSDDLNALKQLESKQLKLRAIEIYQFILDDFPHFKYRDKALFFMAHEYRELGMLDDMINNYRAIIKQHKDSRYVPECYLLIGDYFNNQGDLALAKRHYTAVLDYPQSPAVTIARYKLAWCHINEKGFHDAIKLFEQCVLSETTDDLDIDTYKRVDIKLEALIDIAYCYPESYKEMKPEKAIAYFKEFAWSRSVYTTVLEKLAYRYYIKKRWQHAAVVYRELSELQSDAVKLLEYARNTFECVQNLDSFTDAHKDMAHIIKALRIQKFSVHVADEEKKKNQTDYELYARNIVTLLHENAHKNKSAESFKRAADGYAQYLDFFDDSPVYQEMAVNYAEALFSSGQYFEAGRQYEELAHKKTPDAKPEKKLLYSAVISYYRALKEESDLSYYQTAFTRDGLRKTGTQYASLYPDADQVAHVRFNVAWIAYDEGDYDRAIAEFTDYIQRYPAGEATEAAIHLTLNAYHRKEDFKGLAAFGNSILNQSPIKSKKFRAEVAQIVDASESKIINSLTVAAVNDWEKGRSDLLAFAQKNQQTQLGEQALNALLISGKERHEIETVYTTAKQLIEQYPQSDKLEATMGIMIESMVNVGQFRLLADHLEKYAQAFPGNKNSAAFLQQAGQIRNVLGQPKRANENYTRYLNSTRREGNSQDVIVFSMAANAISMGKQNEAIRLLIRYRKYLSATGKIRADATVADLYLTVGNAKKAAAYRQKAYQAYSPKKAAKDDAMRAAVAGMVFNALDRHYRQYMQIKLGKKIDNSVVQAKSRLLEKLERGYHEVIQFKSPKWALAACHHAFTINQEFAEFLRTAPLPELSSQQKKQYRALVAKKVQSYREKAEQYRSVCVTRAQKWQACDPALAVYLFDEPGTAGKLKQSRPFSTSNRTAAIGEHFLKVSSLRALHEKLMLSPDNSQVLLTLAKAYVDADDYKHAALLAKKIIATTKPENKEIRASAHNILGLAYLFDKNDPAAKDAFQKALELAPQHIGAKMNLAGILNHYGYRQSAQLIYQTLSRAKIENESDDSIHPYARKLYYENNQLAQK